MNTIKLEIQTLDLGLVKEKLRAIATLFPDHSDISIKYCGWAETCDRRKDTVFGSSGIWVDSTKVGTKKFLTKVDGQWIVC